MRGADLRLQLDPKVFFEDIHSRVKKLEAMPKCNELKRDIMAWYAVKCDPYIPDKTDALSDTYHINKDGTLVYNAKAKHNGYHYANRMYEGTYYKKLKRPVKNGDGTIRTYYLRASKFNYTKCPHPKATDHWNLAFEASPDYEKFLVEAARDIRRYLKGDYG